MLIIIITHFLSLILLPSLDEYCDNDKLKDAAKDKQHAHEHPDIKEGNVGNSRNILSHLKREYVICENN